MRRFGRPGVRRALATTVMAASAALAAGATALPAQVPGAALADTAVARVVGALETRLLADVAADGVGAVAAAVVVGDSVVWQGAFGVADRATGALAAPTDLFRAGSLAKPVTALALLALLERGVVGLDDPVDAHVPELRELAGGAGPGGVVTFRALASHTAGLAREPAAEDASRGPDRRWRRQVVAAIPATATVAPPGDRYRYSNMGYAILGLALERAAGVPFETLVRALVLEPLGMTDSFFVLPDRERRRVAAGYVNPAPDSIDPRVPRAELRGRGYRLPSDGLYSTVGDLARLAMAVTGALGDVPVPAGTRALALSDQAPPTAGPDDGASPPAGEDPAELVGTGYGLGFQLHRIGETVIAGHSATVAGYAAYLAADVRAGTAVVLLRNYNHGTTNLAATAVRTLLELADAAAP